MFLQYRFFLPKLKGYFRIKTLALPPQFLPNGDSIDTFAFSFKNQLGIIKIFLAGKKQTISKNIQDLLHLDNIFPSFCIFYHNEFVNPSGYDIGNLPV